MKMNVSGILFKRHVRGLCKRWMSQIASKREIALSEQLWNDTEIIRKGVLETKFVKEIKTGNLDPRFFGGYMVQDAVFCQQVTNGFETAAKNCANEEDKDIKKILEERTEFYKGYYGKYLEDESSGISLSEACKEYVEVINKAANEHAHPIYFLVASIPRLRLWQWIGMKFGDETEPLVITLSDQLWNETKTIKKRVLKTPFVQEIKTGKLDPKAFGSFMVEDAVFLQHVLKGIVKATKNCEKDTDVEKSLVNMQKVYKRYYDKWFKYGYGGIRLKSCSTGCQNYVHSINEAADKHPIYFLVASIPCARLWPWIGSEFNKEKAKNFGCYSTWVGKNFKGDSKHFEDFEEIVNNHSDID